MTSNDFLTLVAPGSDGSELDPVALLLKCGYGCVGHYSASVNTGLNDSCILLNTQIVPLGREGGSNRPSVDDFSEFLEDVVTSYYDDRNEVPTRTEFGKVVPLIAIPLSEVAVVYPVARITQLARRIHDQKLQNAEPVPATPTMFDLKQSEILAVLRTRLW